MKKIALISDGWKRLITYAWVIGIMDEIRNSGEHISLFQFNSHGNWSKDEAHNYGEYNIFKLPTLSEFDGIILDLVNTVDETVCQWVVKLVKESGVPAVSIGRQIEGLYYVGVDNEGTIEEMMDHMYYQHGCRSFIFAGGPEVNCENKIRVKSYERCIAKYDLPLNYNPVWYGTFEFDTGVQYFKDVIENGMELPDAFICANDNIASGIIITAQKYGYHIPEDFRVTGFDNLDKAVFFEPQITTVSQKRETIGGETMKILFDVWKGKTVEKNRFIDSKCIYSESCGCPNSGLLNYRKYIMDKLINEIDKQRSDEELVGFENEITNCNSYDEIFMKTAVYFMGQKCDGFAIVVDKKLYEAQEEAVFATDGYHLDSMQVAYYVDGKELRMFSDVYELKSYLFAQQDCGEYLFSPLHFKDKVIGYTILKNGQFLFDNPYYYDVLNLITKTMHSLYQRLQIECVNEKMKEIYNRDQLTGLYNRIAYSDMIEPKFDECQKTGKRFVLAFVDADDFKQINDVYGHKRGEEILKRIAQVLNQYCPKEGYTYRFGGDEFSVFFPCENLALGKQFKEQVVAELEKDGISVSIGVVVTDPLAKRDLDYYMLLADQDMYRVKQAKRTRI